MHHKQQKVYIIAIAHVILRIQLATQPQRLQPAGCAKTKTVLTIYVTYSHMVSFEDIVHSYVAIYSRWEFGKDFFRFISINFQLAILIKEKMRKKFMDSKITTKSRKSTLFEHYVCSQLRNFQVLLNLAIVTVVNFMVANHDSQLTIVKYKILICRFKGGRGLKIKFYLLLDTIFVAIFYICIVQKLCHNVTVFKLILGK